MNFVTTQIRKIYIMDQILVYVIHEYCCLFVYRSKNPRYLLRGAHHEKYLVTLSGQTIVQYIEWPGYMRMR